MPARRWFGLTVVVVAALTGGCTDPVVADRGWTPAVVPLERFVATAYGRPFEHPVAVRLVSDKDFDQANALQGASCPSTCRAAMATERGLDALVGLPVPGAGSTGSGEVRGADLLGYYVPSQGVLLVRGTKLTAPTRSVVVHELTHAMQDQVMPHLSGSPSSERLLGWRALVESDADRIQDRWDALHPATGPSPRRAPPSTALEAVTIAREEFPYVFGATYLDRRLRETNGDVAAVFASPPTSSAAVLAGTTDPPTPDEADGTQVGALRWLLALTARVGTVEARNALVGMRSDRLSPAAGCRVDHADFDSLLSAIAFEKAARDWSGASTPPVGLVARDGSAVTVAICTSPAPPGPDLAAKVAELLTRESIIDIVARRGGVAVPVAACAVDAAAPATYLNEDPKAVLTALPPCEHRGPA